MNDLRATETNVLNFIGGLDKVFIIPPFQRNYEWNFEQCDELFIDIINSYKCQKSHYLGNIVYYVGKNNGASYNEYILVDGQQRVTSILLLLCALRDSISDSNTFESVNKRYLINDTGDNRFRIRLKQTAYDSQSFMAIIDGRPIEDDENNVAKNYFHFKELIRKSDVNAKDIYETIPKLEVVDVNLQIDDDLSAVQTIFEKINSTGKRLTPADLIRNYLLLSKSSDEQERLYQDYWVKIENTVKNENISRFSRDYLVMNIFDDVPETKIYKMFKEHFTDTGALHIDILRDMYKYSNYYAWIKFEKCPNQKINKNIKLLNFLKSDDVYPLYMYLIANLYDSNNNELTKIFGLLSDFILRYRIVAPGGGGGSLRAVVQQLLEGLNSGIVELSYDAIYFELSNSSAPSGRFPNDEEFRNAIMESVNTNYARALLLRIEEVERKNITVPLEQVTIEHLMPQKLNDWWKDNLGGEEMAAEIHEKYLNCIGNLAPISQGYNSQNSNKPWDIKLKQIKDVQFVITSEIAQNPEWKKENIVSRNKNIADRACIAITSPLERTRKYQSKNATGEFVSGIYPVADITTPMSGTSLDSIVYNNSVIEVSTWKDFFNKICEIVANEDPQLFAKIVAENKIHKATSARNYPEKDPIISEDINKLVGPKKIENTMYYSEGTLSSARARIYAKQLLDIYELTDCFSISVSE